MSLEQPKIDFYENCNLILRKLGEYSADLPLNINCDGKIYSDDVIVIAGSDDPLCLEVYRKSTSDQIIVMSNGNFTVFKGDFIYLELHVNKLIDRLK